MARRLTEQEGLDSTGALMQSQHIRTKQRRQGRTIVSLLSSRVSELQDEFRPP